MIGYLALKDFSLNLPDPNVPVTLSLGLDINILGSYTVGGTTNPLAAHITALPPFLDPFLGAPPVILNDLTDAIFGVTFPTAAALEFEVLETISEIAALIPPVIADPAIGGLATGTFNSVGGPFGPLVGPGILGGLIVDPLPLLVGLTGALGIPLPFDPNDLESADIILDAKPSLTATPVLLDPPTAGPSEVPVPAPIALLGFGIIALAGVARRQRHRSNGRLQ